MKGEETFLMLWWLTSGLSEGYLKRQSHKHTQYTYDLKRWDLYYIRLPQVSARGHTPGTHTQVDSQRSMTERGLIISDLQVRSLRAWIIMTVFCCGLFIGSALHQSQCCQWNPSERERERCDSEDGLHWSSALYIHSEVNLSLCWSATALHLNTEKNRLRERRRRRRRNKREKDALLQM